MSHFDQLYSDLDSIEKDEAIKEAREKALDERRFYEAIDAELDAEATEWRRKR